MTRLHITRDFPPRCNGGISTAVDGLVQAERSQGTTCAVISFDGYRPTSKGPAPKLDTKDDSLLRVTHPGQLEQARQWAVDRKPSSLVCHHDLLWSFAYSVPDCPRTVFVHVLHREQNQLRGTDETMSSKAQETALEQADEILAPSEAAAAAIRVERNGLKVGVLPLRVPVRKVRSQLRDSIVFVGRFADVRGLGDMIEALPAISYRAPSAKLVIVGGCPDSPKAQQRWTEQIEATYVPVTLTGWQDPDTVHEWLCRARVAVVPSWIETFGMTVCEAMLAEAAVVATDLPAIRELVDNKTGVLVPPQSPADLAHAVVSVWSDRSRARALGRAARRKIEASAHAAVC